MRHRAAAVRRARARADCCAWWSRRKLRAPGIDRDLDTILLTCLAKERDGRYASARELAVDLDRYLGKLPIGARPPSLVDRARKLYLRHRVAALAALAAVLITGLVLVPIVLEQHAAKEGARSALELSERVTALLDDAVSLRQTNAMGEANRQLDRGIQECEEFLREHPVPRVHHLLGRLLRARGKVAAARAAFDEALRLDPACRGCVRARPAARGPRSEPGGRGSRGGRAGPELAARRSPARPRRAGAPAGRSRAGAAAARGDPRRSIRPTPRPRSR
jgi:tetratricopeptide (TPR) repeat protein